MGWFSKQSKKFKKLFGSFPWRWKSWCDGEFQTIWEALLGRSDMRLIVNMFYVYHLRENVTPIRFWIKPINVSLAAQIRFGKRIYNVASFVPTHKCKDLIDGDGDFLRYWVVRGTVNSVENNIRNILRPPAPARKPYIGISQGERFWIPSTYNVLLVIFSDLSVHQYLTQIAIDIICKTYRLMLSKNRNHDKGSNIDIGKR